VAKFSAQLEKFHENVSRTMVGMVAVMTSECGILPIPS